MESQPNPPLRTTWSQRLWSPPAVVFQVVLTVLIASALTLGRVEQPVTPPNPADDPTPLGYTWSLLLFLLPILYLSLWFLSHPEYKIQRRAFLITLGVLVPLGAALDLLFAHTFFTFNNTGAVLGIEVPGVGGGIPIEEFVFYVSGFLFVLLLYVWADEFWMDRYNPPLESLAAKKGDPLLSFHKESVITAVVLLAAAVVYKKILSADSEGFPWYWTYLLAAAFIPAAGFYRATRELINWRAFSFTFLLVTMISLLWEATLASPYQWWGYQPDAMMGLFITAWTELPIEAVFVWLVVSFTTVILYEVATVWVATRCRPGELGTRG